MALFGKLGFLIAATGAAHFAAPEVFEDVTKTVFPNDTAEWVKRNGASETAIGLAMMLPKTRRLGLLGLLGYGGWLGYNYNVVSGGAVVDAARSAADTARTAVDEAKNGAPAEPSASAAPSPEPSAEPAESSESSEPSESSESSPELSKSSPDDASDAGPAGPTDVGSA